MSKFQIEKVDHSEIIKELHNCCVLSYYPVSDLFYQANFCNEEFARSCRFTYATGMWRIKSLKNKTN
jgi:hypothetical protein